MKYIRIIICTFNILLFIQCKSQSIQKLNGFKGEEILTHMFNDNDGFYKYCNQLDSIFYGCFFKIPCDFIDALDKTNYNKIKKQADSFDLVKPQVYDGGFYFKCDPRVFEFLKNSCEYYNQYPELRMRKILGSMYKFEKSKNQEILHPLNVLFRENMKFVSEDSLINIYEDIKNIFVLQQAFLIDLKHTNHFKEKYLYYLKYFLLTNRDNINNYYYVLQFFPNIYVESKNNTEKNKILMEERQYVLEAFNSKDTIQNKLLKSIDFYLSNINSKD